MRVTLNNLFRLTKVQIKPAAQVCVRAFQDDPLFVCFIPDACQRKNKLFYLFQFSIRYGLLYGEVYATSPNLEGVAVWLSSEISLWRAIRSGGMSLFFKLGWKTISRMRPVMKHIFSIHRSYVSFPHWYLFLIGVDPAFQGKGYARSLLRAMLDRIDQEHLPCYLETENQNNLSIYRRYGFKVIKDVIIPGTKLHHWLMLREKSP